jgi:hypothetical protein
MRFLTVTALLFAGISGAAAGPVLLTFSGTLGANCPSGQPTCTGTGVGLVKPGDAFSGSAIWDTATSGNNITSFSFTLPASEGLSVPSLPDAKVLFAGADATTIQVNLKSTTDNNFYVLFLPSTSQTCGGPTCAFAVTDGAFTQSVISNTFNSTLVALPEPGTNALVLAGLGLVGLLARGRGRTA